MDTRTLELTHEEIEMIENALQFTRDELYKTRFKIYSVINQDLGILEAHAKYEALRKLIANGDKDV